MGLNDNNAHNVGDGSVGTADYDKDKMYADSSEIDIDWHENIVVQHGVEILENLRVNTISV